MNGTGSDLMERIERAEEAFTVRRVFGEPYEKDGVTVIPAARIRGAVGGGEGEAPGGEGGGTGSGFALNAKPSGVFVIKNGDATWRPAVDVNRVILGAQVVAIAALFFARSVVKARTKVRFATDLLAGRGRSRGTTLTRSGRPVRA
ncbi:MAG: spore germination protein GerW family protein [Actinomycetota bacterium]